MDYPMSRALLNGYTYIYIYLMEKPAYRRGYMLSGINSYGTGLTFFCPRQNLRGQERGAQHCQLRKVGIL